MLQFNLPPTQALVIAVLIGVMFASGLTHWTIVARASRMKAGSGIGDRILPFGFGDWHIGMLRRSWYPAGARQLYKWALAAYLVALAALVLATGLLIAWVVL
jgi:hypothetical protein